MSRIYLITALHTSVHAAFLGSKVVLSLLALKLGADASMVGLLIACYAVPPLLLAVHVGRLADRIGMRAPMVLGAAFVAAAMVTGGLWGALPALFVVATLVGIGFALYMVSSQNLVGGLEGDRTRNYSILTIGYSMSNILGPMVAGYAIEYAGHLATLLLFAFFPLPAIAILFLNRALTRVNLPPAAPHTSRRTADLLGNKPLMRTILISGLQMAAWELYVFFVPIYGHSIGISPSAIGTILGSFAVATFVVRFAIPLLTAHIRVDTLLSMAMLIAAAASVVFPLLHDVPALLAVSFVIGLGMGCGHPLSLTLSFERSPAGRSGEASGLRVTATNLARVAVPLLTGLFSAALGPAALLWLNATVLAGTGYLARRID
jgi:MFS family permease